MPRLQLDIDDIRRLPLTHTATIPEDYLDVMGHMNMMWYSHLFVMGLRGLMASIGFGDLHDKKYHHGAFALEAHLRYLSEVRVGHDVSIHARIVGVSEKRYHFLLFMANDTNEDVAAMLEHLGSYADLRIRRTAPIPEPFVTRLCDLAAEHAKLSWEAPLCGVMAP